MIGLDTNVLAHWAIAPRKYPRGVFRYRNVEEAQAARERLSEKASLVE